MSETRICQDGDVVGQRYKVELYVGQGNYAEVYRAQDMVLDRPVAIKVLSPRGKGEMPNVDKSTVEMDTIQRFYREAKLVANLRSEHTVSMYDFGSTDNGHLYMAMEYIDGMTVKEAIEKDGAFDAERVTNILIRSLKSLREAHTYGLLHRDIKPDNILLFDYLGEKDCLRVLDFGIAKALEDKKSELTAAGVLVGTPRYVPPERINSSEVVPASDIFSLGVMAYEMLTGTGLYPGMSVMDVIRAQMNPDPIQIPPEYKVPEELKRIVEKMMAKSIEHRYTAAQQVIIDLEHFDTSIDIARYTNKNLGESLETARTIQMPAINVLTGRPHTDKQRAQNDQFQTMKPGESFHSPSPPVQKTQAPAPVDQKSKNKVTLLLIAVIALGLLLLCSLIAIIVLISSK